MINTSRIRREQVCARCRNHGIFSILKGHKKECPNRDCCCNECNETEKRRKFIAREIAFHRKNSKIKILENPKKTKELTVVTGDLTKESKREKRRDQMCARCLNHSEIQLIRGHKNQCPYNSCQCKECQITVQRRMIMAKQIRSYRTHKTVDENEQLKESQPVVPDDNESGYSTSPTNSPETEKEAPQFTTRAETKQQVNKELPLMLPIYSLLPPEMLNTFFMVQSLFEKYCLDNNRHQIQFVYAFVILAHQNWSLVENALNRGHLYAEQFFKHHIQMASDHFRNFRQDILPQPAVRVRPMHGNF